MGTWGAGILDSDEALDIYSPYVDNFENGIPLQEIKEDLRQFLFHEGEPVLEDNSGSWLGYAKAQLKTNTVEKQVVSVIKDILDQGIDDDYWEDDLALLTERKKAIAELYEELIKKSSN